MTIASLNKKVLCLGWLALVIGICFLLSCAPRDTVTPEDIILEEEEMEPPEEPKPYENELALFKTVEITETFDPLIRDLRWGMQEDEVIEVLWNPGDPKGIRQYIGAKKIPYQRYRPPEYDYETEETSGIIGTGQIWRKKVREIGCRFLEGRLFRLVFEIDRYPRFETAAAVYQKLRINLNRIYGRQTDKKPKPLDKTYRVDRQYSNDHDFLLVYRDGQWVEGGQEYYRDTWETGDTRIYLLYSYLKAPITPEHQVAVYYESTEKYLQDALTTRRAELQDLRRQGPKAPPRFPGLPPGKLW